MANWCENTLLIIGKPTMITKFVKKAKGNDTDLSLNNLYPMPKELEGISTGGANIDGEYVNEWREVDGQNIKISQAEKETWLKQYGATNWYEWCVSNWGTKWDAEATLVKKTPRLITYSFASAWSPPIQWLKKVAKDYPELLFFLEYKEPGVGFRGSMELKNGEVVYEFEGDYTEEENGV